MDNKLLSKCLAHVSAAKNQSLAIRNKAWLDGEWDIQHAFIEYHKEMLSIYKRMRDTISKQ